jgi:hypothetical protein
METVEQILARLNAELASAKTPEHRELVQRHVRDFELVVQMRERQRNAQQRSVPQALISGVISGY